MGQDTESGVDRLESQSYQLTPKRFEGWKNGKGNNEEKTI